MTQTYSQARMLPGRSPVALVTAGLHVGAFLLFAGASGWVPTPRDVGPTLGFVIDRPTADPLVPPPPLPREASGSELLGESLPLPPEDSTDATLPTLPSAPAATVPVPAATGAGDPPAASPVETPLGYRVRRSQDLFYPAASLRLGEEGSVDVRVCTDAAGAVSGTPEVLRGSGHARLDAAAIAWAMAGLQFQPATRDGVPLAACKGFRLQFRLTR
jgi:periplasmic protein TonB